MASKKRSSSRPARKDPKPRKRSATRQRPPAGRGSPKRIARKGWPSRIVCLTEETVEFLYALGLGDLIVGVSHYAKRPREVSDKPKVSSFIKANTKKILDLKPDLVLTFSDLQADITADLVRAGLPVYASNQRSIDEILATLRQVGALVGYADEAEAKCQEYAASLERIRQRAPQGADRPRVYFEEWFSPTISAIRWVSELIEIAGGEDIFKDLRDQPTAQGRVVSPVMVLERQPEVVLASWCGKPFRRDKFLKRPGFDKLPAVRSGRVHEIPSELILQPGPACLTEGVEMIQRYLLMDRSLDV